MSLEIDTLPPPPTVSKTTILMAGLPVDVYGLADLAPTVTLVSCLWLHHPRTRDRAHMSDIAARCVGAWNETGNKNASSRRGLVALAFDQRNHGHRLVSEKENGSWRDGNPTHAVDMFSGITGMVSDQRGLLDVVEGYLFPDGKAAVDHHLALGVSLGGHSVWQLMLCEPRITAGVAVIGCPDYMNLLTDRARLTKLSTFSAADAGASFLGSKDFPPSLVEACKAHDPKGVFFGTNPVPDPDDPAAATDNNKDAAFRAEVVVERLAGKRFLICNGGADKLVPYRCSEPFLKWLLKAVEEGQKKMIPVWVDNRVYPGVGHVFGADMITDSVKFVVEAMAAKAAVDAQEAAWRESKI
ncbi:hypothetical protein VTJ04DRAFT_6477 [Mycothermus thermophilus]|uniref:uncharacterized protein n=1 Tax=Humicola insolens TaxID=85995 RepID=UPI0037426148